MIDKDQLNVARLLMWGTPCFSNSYYYINIIRLINELSKSDISYVSLVNSHRANRKFEILLRVRTCICSLKFTQKKFS